MSLRIPQEMDRLWINLGLQPLRALEKGTPVVYAAHDAVTFSIGLEIDIDDVYQFTVPNVTGRSAIPHYYLLLNADDHEAIANGEDYIPIPVLDAERQRISSIRFGSQAIGAPLRTELGNMDAEPVTADQIKEGQFYAWYQREALDRTWRLFRAEADYASGAYRLPSKRWNGKSVRPAPMLPSMIVYLIKDQQAIADRIK